MATSASFLCPQQVIAPIHKQSINTVELYSVEGRFTDKETVSPIIRRHCAWRNHLLTTITLVALPSHITHILIRRRRSNTMSPVLWNTTNDKRNVARKHTSSAISKAPRQNLAKKTRAGNRTDPTFPKPRNNKTRQSYIEAVANLVDAARKCDYIDNPDLEAYENFGRIKIKNDYWHMTRVPEAPKTHLVLSRSEPHTGMDLVRAGIAKHMEHIYQDIHEMSLHGLTSSTIDLHPALPQGQTVVSSSRDCGNVP